MIGRILRPAIFVALACAPCLGQTSYKGLTPGQSTRADAERVLGRPVKEVSKTLAEYKPLDDMEKVYVQYADESAGARVERIELFCELAPRFQRVCGVLLDVFTRRGSSDEVTRHAYLRSGPTEAYALKTVWYYGAPAFVVQTQQSRESSPPSAHLRVGLYSSELYESAAPKSCTGTFTGVWETNRGRMTINAIPRTPDGVNVKGSYSAGNGTIAAFQTADSLSGDWKDETGSGTMELSLTGDNPATSTPTAFTGTWERKTGKGPRGGAWEGRCVETKAGGGQ